MEMGDLRTKIAFCTTFKILPFTPDEHGMYISDVKASRSIKIMG